MADSRLGAQLGFPLGGATSAPPQGSGCRETGTVGRTFITGFVIPPPISGTISETAPVGRTQIDARQTFPGFWEKGIVGQTHIEGTYLFSGLVERGTVGRTSIEALNWIPGPGKPGVSMAAIEVALHHEQGHDPPELTATLVALEYYQNSAAKPVVTGVWLEVFYKKRVSGMNGMSVVNARYSRGLSASK